MSLTISRFMGQLVAHETVVAKNLRSSAEAPVALDSCSKAVSGTSQQVCSIRHLV